MSDHGTFDGPMPVQANTIVISLVCSSARHRECAVTECTCPCHVEEVAA